MGVNRHKWKCPYCGEEFEDCIDYCIHVEECEIKFYLTKLREECDGHGLGTWKFDY